MENLAIFSEHCTETELPVITTDVKYNVIEFNKQCAEHINGICTGTAIHITPLSGNSKNSFPYTAIITVGDKEFLSCICRENAPRRILKIYFVPFGYDTVSLLHARYIIERKRLEASGVSTQNPKELYDISALAAISHTFSEASFAVLSSDDIYKLAEYTVFRLKQISPDKMNTLFDFSCSERTFDMGVNTALALICMITVFLSQAKEKITFTVDRTQNYFTFEITVNGTYSLKNAASCGFAGFFLSRIVTLNDWDYTQSYDSPTNSSKIVIVSPIEKNKFKLSSQDSGFDLEAFLLYASKIMFPYSEE